jgi:hypothetical protein
MTTITHTAVGGALGSLGLGPFASFAVGFGSHLPLDLVPHWDIKQTWVDTLLTVAALGAILLVQGGSPVFWGAAGGALPDLEHLLPLPRKYFPGHGAHHGRALGVRHAWWQGVLAGIAGLFAIRAVG